LYLFFIAFEYQLCYNKKCSIILKRRAGVEKFLRGPGFYLILLIVIIYIVSNLNYLGSNREVISYTKLLEAIDKGKVAHILIIERNVYGVYQGSNISENALQTEGEYDFTSRIFTEDSFYEDVRRIEARKLDKSPEEITAQDFSFTVDTQPPAEPPWWINIIPFVVIVVLFGLFWFFFIQQTQGGGNRVMSFGKSRARMHTDEKEG